MAALEHSLPRASVLLVEDNEPLAREIATVLRDSGYDVSLAGNGREALAVLSESVPDVVVSDIVMPEMNGLQLLTELRADRSLARLPVIFLSSQTETEDIVEGFDLGADDYVPKPFHMPELEARIRSKVGRPPVPVEVLGWDRQTDLVSTHALTAELKREIARTRRRGGTGCLALVGFAELDRIRERFGARVEKSLDRQIGQLLMQDSRTTDLAGRDRDGRFALLLPETGPNGAEVRLRRLLQIVVRSTFSAGGERFRLTPAAGYVVFTGNERPEDVCERASVALDHAGLRLDLEPVSYAPAMGTRRIDDGSDVHHGSADRRPRFGTMSLPLQIAAVHLLGIVLPFVAYLVLARMGYDVVSVAYLALVAALLMTAAMIWIEGFAALKESVLPDAVGPPPPVTAIVAAYLPNEAATIVETVESFLRVDYPGPYQVILAYNTPRDLPIEAMLGHIADRDARFLPLRVEGSTSKAQNVNAALAETDGEIVGVFDADHHPAPDAFTRAWRWIASGYDVVQGHCVVRNGADSEIARTVAVEFEMIYGVSHPGRARLHGFGIFGGSNGFWRTDLLRQTRMHGFMLTEDIDSSLRVVRAGYKIKSDPRLISRELAPVTVHALWNQRLRWAQGWFQVSRRHLWPSLRSGNLSVRQKLGFLYLLGWREIYPWISLQMWPIIGYWIWQYGSVDRIDWLIPIFVLTTIFTLSAGPGQVLYASILAEPEIRANRRWFWLFLLWSPLYSEFKTLIGRVAQVKELMGERHWTVTPR